MKKKPKVTSKVSGLAILASDVGEEYLKALSKVIEIRKERFKIYGNSFLEDSLDDLIVYTKGKIHRFEVMNKKKTQNNSYEKFEDQILDAINYALFSLAKIIKKNKQ